MRLKHTLQNHLKPTDPLAIAYINDRIRWLVRLAHGLYRDLVTKKRETIWRKGFLRGMPVL